MPTVPELTATGPIGEDAPGGAGARLLHGGPLAQRFDVAEAAEEGIAEPEYQRLTQDLLKSIDSLSVKSKKHIAVPKHAWDRVVVSPGTFKPSDESEGSALHDESWEQVDAVMRQVVSQGREVSYRSVFQRVLEVNGEQVVVTFAKLAGGPRVSDAWVVTKK